MYSRPTSATRSWSDQARLIADRQCFQAGILALILALVVPVLLSPTAGQAAMDPPRAQAHFSGDRAINNSLAASWIANSANLSVYGCSPGYDIAIQAPAVMEYDCDAHIGPVDITLVDGQYGTEQLTTSGQYPKNRVTTHNLDFEDDYFADNAGEGIPAILYSAIPAGYDTVVVWCEYVALSAPANNWGPAVMPSYGTAIEVAVNAGDTINCSWFFGQDGYTFNDNTQGTMIELPDSEPSVKIEPGAAIPTSNDPLVVITPPALIEQELIPDQPVAEEQHPPDPIMPSSRALDVNTCDDNPRIQDEAPEELEGECVEPEQRRG